MNKKFWIIVDTETTEKNHVADFGAVICDRQGHILKQVGVLTPFFLKEKLFYNKDSGFFGKRNLATRTENYRKMVKDGSRRMANIQAINSWLALARVQYNPVLVAYNIAFDQAACDRSGIDLTMFSDSFCLWQEAARIFGSRVSYINHVLEHKAISPALNVRTNADTMAKFLSVEPLKDEPHTALEDARDYERLILVEILRAKKGIKGQSYNWRNHRLIDHVAAKIKRIKK